MTSPDSRPQTGALTRRQLRERQAAATEPSPPSAISPAVGEAPTPPVSPASATTETVPFHAPDAGSDATTQLFAPEHEETIALPGESPVAVRWADSDAAPTALAWLTADRLTPASVGAFETTDAPSLLADAPRRSALRPSLVVPAAALAALLGAYATTMIVWPLHEVAPRIAAVEVVPATSPAADISWSSRGSGSIGIEGVGAVASTSDTAPIASIAKVVSSLMVLDRQPLSVGESGPSYSFTWADSNNYWQYLSRNESALDVPVGGTLTQYELLQGTLLGSANNYIERLTREIWGSNDNFAAAARDWLHNRGLDGIELVDSSGIDPRNTADPASLVKLAEIAMANPVIREIVSTPVATIPGAGEVENTNPLVGTPGVTGVKTGSMSKERSGLATDYWNVLTTKEIVVGETIVPISVAVIGQPTMAAREAETESLLAQVEEALATQPPTVAAGTIAGEVTTAWGEAVDIVTDQPTRVVLWDGATATTRIDLALGENRDAGDRVGTLTTVGPIDTNATSLSLAAPIEGPSIWWRLTHPLELLGLTG